MKKGQVYEGIVELVDFPNKARVFLPEEDRYVVVKNAVKGQKVTIKPETAAGYTYSGSVISWTERGVKKSLTLSANELIFTMPNSAISIAPSAVCTVELPSPNVLVYNGNEQSPVWSNYDSSTLTIGGVYSATNAGTYEATFTPKATAC